MADCIAKAKGSTSKRLWAGFKCYNGAAAYADDAMSILRDKIILTANIKLPAEG